MGQSRPLEEDAYMLKTVTRFGEILLSAQIMNEGLGKSFDFLRIAFDADFITLSKSKLINSDRVFNLYYSKVHESLEQDQTATILRDFPYKKIANKYVSQIFEGKPVVCDIEVLLNDSHSDYVQVVAHSGLKSLVVIPVIFGEEYWGDLVMGHTRHQKQWEEGDLFYFKIMAQQLANFIKFYEGEKQLKSLMSSDHSQKMATLGEMAAGIAHEINNPLFIINAFATKIDNLVDRNELDVKALKRVSFMIQKNCKRISGIVSGLRMFSRDTTHDDFEVACLRDIIQESLEFSKERMRIHEIKLKVDLGENELPVECKPSQLSQVIVNLLNNSYDSIIEGDGEKWIKVFAKEEKSRILLSITDCGEKLPIKEQQRIMEPFYTTKSVGKGTGLGLSISREIINRHQGDFYIDPFCDNVRFVIELPKIEFE